MGKDYDQDETREWFTVIVLTMSDCTRRRAIAYELRSRGFCVVEVSTEWETQAVAEAGLLPKMCYVQLDSPKETMSIAEVVKENWGIPVWVGGIPSIETAEPISLDRVFPPHFGLSKLVTEIERKCRFPEFSLQLA